MRKMGDELKVRNHELTSKLNFLLNFRDKLVVGC